MQPSSTRLSSSCKLNERCSIAASINSPAASDNASFIARCLIQQPKVLLLDEPTNNLDLRYQMQFLQLLRDLAHTQNLAILMSAHDINLAADFSDRLVLLQGGRKLADGPPAEILHTELLQTLYGLPMELIPREGRSPLVFPARP